MGPSWFHERELTLIKSLSLVSIFRAYLNYAPAPLSLILILSSHFYFKGKKISALNLN